MTKLEQAARQALGALEVATTPLAKDRQEVLRAITTLREALSGVQALSAAPEAFLKSVIALCSHRGYSPANIEAWDKDDKWIADLWRQAESMLAASPTPPAEQQAQPGAVGRTGCTAGTDEECTRRGCATSCPALQAAPKAAPGDAIDEAMRERDDAEDFIDALLDEVLGHERPEWSNLYGRADALNDVQERMTSLHKPAVDKAWGQFQSAKAAPQQEAQEPCGWLYEWTHSSATGKPVATYTAFTTNEAHASKHDNCRAIYAAPQPAAAPLSEREAFERDWEKRNAPVPINGRTRDDGRYGDSSIQDAWESWQARAALAAQGGK